MKIKVGILRQILKEADEPEIYNKILTILRSHSDVALDALEIILDAAKVNPDRRYLPIAARALMDYIEYRGLKTEPRDDIPGEHEPKFGHRIWMHGKPVQTKKY